MAAREFHGVIKNEWESPLVHSKDDVDGGEWQDPWYPSRVPGAGKIDPGGEGEWRSESDGFLTGTSGWARWGVRVFDVDDDHFEFIQVNWSVPFYGTPNITWAVFRNKPDDPDPWVQPDARPPTLEIIATFWSEDGQQPALAAGATIAPYVFAFPWSLFTSPSVSTHPRVSFTVRRRARSPLHLTFPNVLPNRQAIAMASFRNRAELAVPNGFIGGFPNFYEAVRGRDHLGGTIFIKPPAAEWRDVPLSELGNVSLENFEERIRATNAYASRNGFVGGFPTFFHADYGGGVVCGTILIKSDGGEWRDVPLVELGSPALDDFESRFRATQDYATRNGFVGGFPNLYHAERVLEVDPRTGRRTRGTVCGTVLLKRGEVDIRTGGRRHSFAERRDVVVFRDPA